MLYFCIVFRAVWAINIYLTTAQERFIQSKIFTGKYQSAQEVGDLAFFVLEEY